MAITQNVIIQNLNRYLTNLGREIRLDQRGVCAGLDILCVKAFFDANDNRLKEDIESLLLSDDVDLTKENPEIEKLISNIQWLQIEHETLMPGLTQEKITQVMQVASEKPLIEAASFTMPMEKDRLKELIESLSVDQDISLNFSTSQEDGMHRVSLIYTKGEYYLCDVNVDIEPVPTTLDEFFNSINAYYDEDIHQENIQVPISFSVTTPKPLTNLNKKTIDKAHSDYVEFLNTCQDKTLEKVFINALLYSDQKLIHYLIDYHADELNLQTHVKALSQVIYQHDDAALLKKLPENLLKLNPGALVKMELIGLLSYHIDIGKYPANVVLEQAIKTDKSSVIVNLLEKYDIRHDPTGNASLADIAILKNNVTALAQLLKKNIVPFALNLEQICLLCSVSTFETLLDHGAINLEQNFERDGTIMSVIDLCIDMNKVDLVKYLVEQYPEQWPQQHVIEKTIDKNNENMIFLLLQHANKNQFIEMVQLGLNITDGFGEDKKTPLMMAIDSGDLALINSARIAYDYHVKEAYKSACEKVSGDDKFELQVRACDLYYNCKDSHGYTAADYAYKAGNKTLFEFLLQRQCDIHADTIKDILNHEENQDYANIVKVHANHYITTAFDLLRPLDENELTQLRAIETLMTNKNWSRFCSTKFFSHGMMKGERVRYGDDCYTVPTPFVAIINLLNDNTPQTPATIKKLQVLASETLEQKKLLWGAAPSVTKVLVLLADPSTSIEKLNELNESLGQQSYLSSLKL